MKEKTRQKTRHIHFFLKKYIYLISFNLKIFLIKIDSYMIYIFLLITNWKCLDICYAVSCIYYINAIN